MPEDSICKKCKKEMKLLEEKIIAGTKYKILKCGKCYHKVARAETG